MRAGGSLVQAKELLVETPYGGNELGVFRHPLEAGVASECGRRARRDHVWGFIDQGKVGLGGCPNARRRHWWVFLARRYVSQSRTGHTAVTNKPQDLSGFPPAEFTFLLSCSQLCV